MELLIRSRSPILRSFHRPESPKGTQQLLQEERPTPMGLQSRSGDDGGQITWNWRETHVSAQFSTTNKGVGSSGVSRHVLS